MVMYDTIPFYESVSPLVIGSVRCRSVPCLPVFQPAQCLARAVLPIHIQAYSSRPQVATRAQQTASWLREYVTAIKHGRWHSSASMTRRVWEATRNEPWWVVDMMHDLERCASAPKGMSNKRLLHYKSGDKAGKLDEHCE